MGVLIVLSGPHLMLTDLRTDNRIPFGRLVNLFHDIRACQSLFVIFQREPDFQVINKGAPFFVIFLLKKGIQSFQNFFYIPDHTCGHQNIFIDLCRVYVDLQDFCMGCKTGGIPEHPVTETRSNGHQQITFGYAKIGVLGAMHAQHSGIEGMFSAESTFSHQRIAHRSIQLLRKHKQLLGCVGSNGAASHKDHGLLCLIDQTDCLFQIFLFDRGIIRNDLLRSLCKIFGFVGRRIFGYINEHRTRPPGFCDFESPTDHSCQICNVFYNKIMFCHRNRDPGDIHLLKAVFSKE